MNKNLKQIISGINMEIQGRLADVYISDYDLLGISFPCYIPEDIVDISGFIVKEEEFDRTVPVFGNSYRRGGIYHHLTQKTYENKPGFGDEDIQVETSEINLVCWMASGLIMPLSDFERNIIVPSLPDNVNLISSNFDSMQVISDEFNYTNYQLSPENNIFSVKYSIQRPIEKEDK